MGKSNILSGKVEFVPCVRSRAQETNLGFLCCYTSQGPVSKKSHPESLLVHICAENVKLFHGASITA